MSKPLLLAYDGPPDAQQAIVEAARLMPGSPAVVLYARQPLESVAAHLEGHRALEDVRSIDDKTLDASERLAAEGTAYARSVGRAARREWPAVQGRGPSTRHGHSGWIAPRS